MIGITCDGCGAEIKRNLVPRGVHGDKQIGDALLRVSISITCGERQGEGHVCLACVRKVVEGALLKAAE